MKDKFESILEQHGIYGEDIEEILNAVNEMLLLVANKTKEDTPYATSTISFMESGADAVLELIWYFEYAIE